MVWLTHQEATLPVLFIASNAGAWRSNFFGEHVKTNHGGTLSFQCRGPASAPEPVRLPWSFFHNNGHHPIMPAKAAAVLHKAPPFVKTRRATLARDGLEARVNERVGSEFKDRFADPKGKDRDPAELKKSRAESSACPFEQGATGESCIASDTTVAPLHIRKISRPKRKNSATSGSGASSSVPQQRIRRSNSDLTATVPYRTQAVSLQRRALKQTENFSVLSLEEVEQLSCELFDLDIRCDYIRQARSSLRDGRKSLHGKMITYLRCARPATFSQENLLTQEEVLAVLDTALEVWEVKLETVRFLL